MLVDEVYRQTLERHHISGLISMFDFAFIT
jgi:hypothetical protein